MYHARASLSMLGVVSTPPQYVISDPDIALRPSAALIFVDDLCEHLFEGLFFFFLCPPAWPMNLAEFIFHTRTHTHGVVHIGSFLEFSGSGESLLTALASFWVMLRPSNPSDVVLLVIIAAFL